MSIMLGLLNLSAAAFCVWMGIRCKRASMRMNALLQQQATAWIEIERERAQLRLRREQLERQAIAAG